MKTVLVKNLYFSYKKEIVLKDINFSVDEKDFLSIIGPNGGGKSTLIKLIMGELTPQKGIIKVFGKEPHLARSQIGYVPQNTNVNLEFPIRVIDVVMMGNRRLHQEAGNWFERLFPIKYNETEKRCAYSTLEKVGMQDYINRRIGDLSGGQRQRVMIARALCAHPKLLILDEPTSSIDAKGQEDIYKLLKELNQDITIIIVSHDLSGILKYSDKVLYVNREAYMHDLKESPIDINRPEDEHFCQIEMMQMLRERK